MIAAGRALDEPMIAEVSGIEPDALHVALREAVAEQVLVTCEPTRLSFRHALLREALYDDLLPGRAERAPPRARARVRGPRRLRERPGRRAGVRDRPPLRDRRRPAGGAPRDRPGGARGARGARVRRGRRPRRARARAVAARPGRRPDDLRSTTSSCSGSRRPRTASPAIAGARRGAAPARAQGARSRQRPAGATPSCSRGCRGVSGRSTAAARRSRRPSGRCRCCPRTRSAASARRCWSGLARMRYLRGRFREALTEGEEALETASPPGDRRSESEVLNTLGMAGIVTGSIDEGIESAAPGDRDRPRGRRRRRRWAPRTRTWPTC